MTAPFGSALTVLSYGEYVSTLSDNSLDAASVDSFLRAQGASYGSDLTSARVGFVNALRSGNIVTERPLRNRG